MNSLEMLRPYMHAYPRTNFTSAWANALESVIPSAVPRAVAWLRNSSAETTARSVVGESALVGSAPSGGGAGGS
jgi:hypothetical protein